MGRYMLNKPESCRGCSLYEKGKGFVPDKLAKTPRIVFLAEAPGGNEVIKGEPLVGKAGFVLHNWGVRAVPPMQLAIEKGQVSLCNTLRCQPPDVQGRPYPKGKDKELAEAHCRQYDQWLVPSVKTVICFGETPQRLLFKQELDAEDASDRLIGHDVKGVMGRIGRTYERDGVTYVFAPHPAFVLRQPALVQHLQEALRIGTNCEIIAHPKQVDWTTAMQELI